MKKNVKIVCLCLAAVGLAGACVGSVYGGIALAGASVSSDVCGLPDQSKWIVGIPKSYSGHQGDLRLYASGFAYDDVNTYEADFRSLSFPSPYYFWVPGQPDSVVFFDLKSSFGDSWVEPGSSVSGYSGPYRLYCRVSIVALSTSSSSGGDYYGTKFAELSKGPGVYLISFGDSVSDGVCSPIVSFVEYPLCAGEASSK